MIFSCVIILLKELLQIYSADGKNASGKLWISRDFDVIKKYLSYEVDQLKGINIDTNFDFYICEQIYKNQEYDFMGEK